MNFLLSLLTPINFGETIEQIINSNLIASTDLKIANLLVAFRSLGLTKFFLWLTLLGNLQVVLIFILAAILLFWLWQKQIYLLPFLLGIGGGELFTLVGKLILHRPRPEVALYTENLFSFPSGHATIAVTFYGFLTYWLIKNTKPRPKKITIFIIGLLIIILLGFSRLYLGVHYLSDVWGGYLVGAIWLIIAISLSEYISYKKPTIEISSQKTAKRLLTIGLILVSIGLYSTFALNYQETTPLLPLEKNLLPLTTWQQFFGSAIFR